MSQHAMDFAHFDAEAYLARRLGEHGTQVFTGVTDAQIRKDRFRAAIIDGGHSCTIIGRNLAGKVETQLFERMFNEPLIAKTRKGKRP